MTDKEFNLFRVRWRKAVIDERRIKPIGRFALLVLEAVYINSKSREAWPSMPELVRTVGASEHPVRNGLKQAVDLGYLEVSRGGGRRQSNRYRLALPSKLPADDRLIEEENPAPHAGNSGQNPAPHAGFKDQNPAPHAGFKDQNPAHLAPKTPQISAQNPARGAGEPVENQMNEPEGRPASSRGAPMANVQPTSGDGNSNPDVARAGESARLGGAPSPLAASGEELPPQKETQDKKTAPPSFDEFWRDFPACWPGADSQHSAEFAEEYDRAEAEWLRLEAEGEDMRLVLKAAATFRATTEEELAEVGHGEGYPTPSEWLRAAPFQQASPPAYAAQNEETVDDLEIHF